VTPAWVLLPYQAVQVLGSTSRANRAATEQNLIDSFGADYAAEKRQNFIDLGPKEMSVLAFHNLFFEQIRMAFIIGAYYPALTAACALGERILNHLTLLLRDDFRATPEFKKVYGKDSFDNWDVPIDTLETWRVLLPDVASDCRRLKQMRNDALHFRPDVDGEARRIALDAIKCLASIISKQFGAFGKHPWFFSIPGEIYIKKQAENEPFVAKVYLPNGARVGPRHKIVSVLPWRIEDETYENKEISDDDYSALRRAART
jgi:hypothetical protein